GDAAVLIGIEPHLDRLDRHRQPCEGFVDELQQAPGALLQLAAHDLAGDLLDQRHQLLAQALAVLLLQFGDAGDQRLHRFGKRLQALGDQRAGALATRLQAGRVAFGVALGMALDARFLEQLGRRGGRRFVQQRRQAFDAVHPRHGADPRQRGEAVAAVRKRRAHSTTSSVYSCSSISPASAMSRTCSMISRRAWSMRLMGSGPVRLSMSSKACTWRRGIARDSASRSEGSVPLRATPQLSNGTAASTAVMVCGLWWVSRSME